MQLDQIKNMYDRDSQIDGTELDIESIKLPQLHNKYLNLLQDEKLVLRKLIADKSEMFRLKWEYYSGKMDKDELDKEINGRHWKIRNAIEWRKFTNGGF